MSAPGRAANRADRRVERFDDGEEVDACDEDGVAKVRRTSRVEPALTIFDAMHLDGVEIAETSIAVTISVVRERTDFMDEGDASTR